MTYEEWHMKKLSLEWPNDAYICKDLNAFWCNIKVCIFKHHMKLPVSRIPSFLNLTAEDKTWKWRWQIIQGKIRNAQSSLPVPYFFWFIFMWSDRSYGISDVTTSTWLQLLGGRYRQSFSWTIVSLIPGVNTEWLSVVG